MTKILIGNEKRKQRTCPKRHILAPQKEEDTLPSHTADTGPNTKHRGSLRSSRVAATGSHTVYIRTVIDATTCKKITSKQLHAQDFSIYTATQPRATLNLSPEACGTPFYIGEQGDVIDGCVHINTQLTVPSNQNQP